MSRMKTADLQISRKIRKISLVRTNRRPHTSPCEYLDMFLAILLRVLPVLLRAHQKQTGEHKTNELCMCEQSGGELMKSYYMYGDSDRRINV